jgi:RNA polymerase subunit RPABC4/transcription elongation factor Spt4
MLAIFGIDGGSIGLVLNLLILFLVVTYVALIYWTYQDAKRRIEDPVLIACATAASFFPFIGTVVYTILRPPEFLEDREERQLELRAAELRLRQLIEQSCPHCEYPIGSEYLRCPNCERRLRTPCRKCSRALDPKWGVCPYCETEVRRQRAERGSDRDRTRAARAARAERSRPSRSTAEQGRESRAPASEARPDASGRRAQRSAVSAEGQPRQSQQRPSGGSGRSGD